MDNKNKINKLRLKFQLGFLGSFFDIHDNYFGKDTELEGKKIRGLKTFLEMRKNRNK